MVRLHSKEDICGRAGVKSTIMLPGSILFASAHPDTPIKVGHAWDYLNWLTFPLFLFHLVTFSIIFSSSFLSFPSLPHSSLSHPPSFPKHHPRRLLSGWERWTLKLWCIYNICLWRRSWTLHRAFLCMTNKTVKHLILESLQQHINFEHGESEGGQAGRQVGRIVWRWAGIRYSRYQLFSCFPCMQAHTILLTYFTTQTKLCYSLLSTKGGH